MVMRVECLLPLLLFWVLILPGASAQEGFVSIQCCATSNTTDQRTKIAWTSDDFLFSNVGICKNISGPFATDLSHRRARIFGTDYQNRWCYYLPVVHGRDYLVRASFLNDPILQSMAATSFNISIGSTSISQVNSSLNFMEVEGIFAATHNHTNICVVKRGGYAYISEIELRPLNDVIYLNGSSSTVLKTVARVDLGNKDSVYRYPVDPADRIWSVEANLSESAILGSSDISMWGGGSSIPLEVLRTAATDAEKLQFLHTNLDISHDDYLIILYFVELDVNVQTAQRVFDIYVNGDKYHEKFDILRNGNASNYREVSMRVQSKGYLNISLVKALDAIEYGPICNAYEIFEVHQKAAETVKRDVNAMVKLRDDLLVENTGNVIFKSWQGDPCVPSPWEGLTCEERNSMFIITKLNLSSKNLRGSLPTVISDLVQLQELDVQSNDFTGSIPETFTSFPRLSKLSIEFNTRLNSQLTHGLSDQTNSTVNSTSCIAGEPCKAESPQQTVYFIGGIAGGSVACSVALGILFTCFFKRARPDKKDHLVIKNPVFSESSIHDPYTNPVVQSFSLHYIKNATCHYKSMIGEGGFGAVYRGTLPHGQEVAVKVRSATSTQGTREFDNEVNLLSAIHHENLVPLLGYCCENDQQILVYPFMSNGSLQDRLYGEASKRKVLDWPTRLSIAIGAARGLMYLHTFAGRCIIHRDVKSSNILLDHSMCGKVADFGFSKYAPQEGDSNASLEVRGTAGYLDPEYYSTQQLSTKSDVFSFGVVLLEIVTGKEPLNIHRPRNEWSLVEWAKPFIREQRIEEIVDPSIKGTYHAEAMFRVVETALACIEPFSAFRPSMVDILRELEDALIIENNASEYMRSIESFGGSNRFVSIERKMLAPNPTTAESSSTYGLTIAIPQPR